MLSRRKFLAATGAGLLGAATGARSVYAQDQEGFAPATSGVLPVDSYFDGMATDSTDPLGVIWVLAIDISGSINSRQGEYEAQISAFADAIERDDFRESIFGPGGPGSAGIFVVDYDSKSKLQIGGVDFRENDRERFREFADRIRNLQRRSEGGTRHDTAMENASVCFDLANQRGWTSDRKYVNIMTDGTGSQGYNHYYRRLLAQRHEAIVSSLVIRPRNSVTVFDRAREELTTPEYTFRRSDGSFLGGGITEEVATELETQSGNISRYQDKTFMVMRRQITMHTAGLDFDNNNSRTRFASAEPVSRRGLIKPPGFTI